MAQLTIDDGISTADRIEQLHELYGRVEDIRDFEEYCDRRGAFIGHSIEAFVRVGHVALLRRHFKKKVNGLRRVIWTGDAWIPRRLCTQDEHRLHCMQCLGGIQRDQKSLTLELEYHEDRWHVALVLAAEDMPEVRSEDDEE